MSSSLPSTTNDKPPLTTFESLNKHAYDILTQNSALKNASSLPEAILMAHQQELIKNINFLTESTTKLPENEYKKINVLFWTTMSDLLNMQRTCCQLLGSAPK